MGDQNPFGSVIQLKGHGNEVPIRPQDLQYFVLTHPDLFHLKANQLLIYNQIFNQWKNGWTKTFKELESKSEVSINDFLRQSAFGTLLYRGQLIAAQSSTFFDLKIEPHYQHPYIQRYPQEYLDYLVKNKTTSLMSIEYLYLDPRWRKSIIGISLSNVLLSLAMKFFESSPSHLAISVPRNNRSINKIFYQRGSRAISKDLELHNVKVDLVYLEHGAYQETGSIEDVFIDYLWNNIMDLTNFRFLKQSVRKVISK